MLSASLAWVAFANIGENLVYYWKPSEMVAQGEKALNWKKFAITESVLCARDDDRQALERHPDDASDTLTLERQENVALILAAVRRLHAVHRQLLEWLIAGKNSRSYAQAHGLTHQRVNQRLTKARAALRRELNNAHVWASHLVVDETRTV
jgi:DNA-directed RNA polymerase specialized sigma24 family protein